MFLDERLSSFSYFPALKSPTNSSRCLGQLQAAEKEDVIKTSLDEKDKALQPAATRNHEHRKVFQASESEESIAHNLGLNIVRCISQNFLNDERIRTLRFSTRFASGKEEETSNPYSGEIGSVGESESNFTHTCNCM